MSKRVLNAAAGKMRMLVNGLAAVLVSRIYVNYLGLELYGEIASILAFVSLFVLLGNAISDAAVKAVSQQITAQNYAQIDKFLSNAICLIGYIFVLGLLIGFGVEMMSPGGLGGLSLMFYSVVLAGACLNLAASLFRCGSFYHEKLVASAFVFSFSRLLYALVAGVLIVYFAMSYWSVAIANFAAALVAACGMFILLRKNIPSLDLSISHFSWSEQQNIMRFMGWMLLVYCGVYCANNFIVVVSKYYLPIAEVGKLALGLQISSLSGQLMYSFSLLTGPSIYRFLSEKNTEMASRGVTMLIIIVVPAIFCGSSIIYFNTDKLLTLWLGEDFLQGSMMFILLAAFCNASVITICAPLCAFYAGMNKIKNYGMICLGEAGIIILLVLVVLNTSYSVDSKIQCVVWVPTGVVAVKVLFLTISRYAGLVVNWWRISLAIAANSLLAAVLFFVRSIVDFGFVLETILYLSVFTILLFTTIKVNLKYAGLK